MYYLIGIGGTGAKCVESVVHMAAAGLLPPEEIFVFFVDPDEANGSLGRAQVTLSNYVACRTLALGSVDLFKNVISVGRPDVWSPFQGSGRKRLDQFFNYESLLQHDPAAAHLMDVLFSPTEKATELSEGFRGHPSIGAAVMGKTVDPTHEEPWAAFEAHLKRDAGAHGQDAKVMLFGSVFGGTGAAGIPTIGRLILQRLNAMNMRNVSVGVAMLLPYFSFERVGGDTLKADAHDFLLSTHAALKYYYTQDYLSTFRAVYFLGERRLSHMAQTSKGGRGQQNEPHFMELYAALAAVDFFSNERVGPCTLIARDDGGAVRWSDLPGKDSARRKLAQLTRFAVAYKYLFHPVLVDIAERGRGYRAPFYVQYFQRRRVALNQGVLEQLKQVGDFCDKFLRWMGYVHESAAGNPKVELADYYAFCGQHMPSNGKNGFGLLDEFHPDRFPELILPAKREEALRLGDVWEDMCDSRVRDNRAEGVGRFLHALYGVCGRGLGVAAEKEGKV